jgi:translation initiation factor 2 gamma subunit (eIF-2gamma)
LNYEKVFLTNRGVELFKAHPSYLAAKDEALLSSEQCQVFIKPTLASKVSVSPISARTEVIVKRIGEQTSQGLLTTSQMIRQDAL